MTEPATNDRNRPTEDDGDGGGNIGTLSDLSRREEGVLIRLSVHSKPWIEPEYLEMGCNVETKEILDSLAEKGLVDKSHDETFEAVYRCNEHGLALIDA